MVAMAKENAEAKDSALLALGFIVPAIWNALNHMKADRFDWKCQ